MTQSDTLLRLSDTLAAAAGSVRDTLSQAPLPGGLAGFFRFLFQVPQWIQIGGAAIAAVAVVWLLVVLWRRRIQVLTWLRSRSRQVQFALGGVLVLFVALAGLAGMKSWNYMQHENAFCTGCHIMERPFRRFAAGAGKHEELKCHDCHQQSIFASTRQMVMWVAERPEKIGAHAPVPNSRCLSCHQVEGREPWQHVRRLAGHRVHFESDSAALKGLACVKCHGAEVHKFIPSARTCEQSKCHEQQPIRLSHMEKLPQISCVTCHNFTADLPGLATTDSARGALVPQQAQCFSCHQMKARLASFDAAKDPHNGSCGFCHDVHAHRRPADARGSCAKCHSDLSKSPFHAGGNHARVQSQCQTCHQPHAASVDASNCVGCHQEVRRRGLFKAPLPFDTSEVVRRRVTPSGVGGQGAGVRNQRSGVRGQGAGEWEWEWEKTKGGPHSLSVEEGWPRVRASPSTLSAATPLDSFPHSRHRSLACLTCHRIDQPGRTGRLVFEIPRGCDLCHHQVAITGRVEGKDCARCHGAMERMPAHPSTVLVQVGSRSARSRMIGFRHDRHSKLACADCHRPPAVAPPDSVTSCTACHAQHHEVKRDCAQCHNTRETRTAHDRSSHIGCAACHTPATIARLVPTRIFCLTCHEPQRNHRPEGECTTCHFLAPPAAFGRELMRVAP